MPPLKQKLVLVVDDIPTNITIISGVLKDSFRIKVATNGKKALAMARAPDKPDLILLDVVMPGMDGYEVCRHLKATPATREIPGTALKRIVSDSERGGDVIGSIQGMVKKGEEERARLDINDLIREVMRLVQGELKNRGVSSRAELADDLPRVLADRIQLRQVILNLIMNAIEAMGSVSDPASVLRVRSEKHGDDGVLPQTGDSHDHTCCVH
jgi:CheY-like chemotaxis protein